MNIRTNRFSSKALWRRSYIRRNPGSFGNRRLYMNTDRKQRIRKNLINYTIFLLIMGLTFYTVLRGQDWNQIW